MDYALKIRRLEEEARHEKTMRELQGERLDIHDRHFELLDGILERTEKNIEALSVSQVLTQKMLQDLIELLTKPGGNGKH